MKVVNSIQIFYFCFFISICSYGQIYEGSNGDGFDRETVSSITLTNLSLAVLYDGSNGDGFSNRILSATTLNNTDLAVLYDGSNGDGFSNQILSATTLNNTDLAVLYDGSNGDGFSNQILSATTLNNTDLAVLYDGSNGDGFSSRILEATTLENISLIVLYEGSNGDGFSSRTLQATTLENLSLTVLYEGSNGDGFSVRQENLFLDPNAEIDLRLNAIVLLQGSILSPETPGLMNDILRDVGMLPTTSPYADEVVVNPSVFNTGGTSGTGSIEDDIVDWVWLEIRRASDNTLVVDSKSALLQRDGDVVGLDGISDVIFSGNTDLYHVVVNHRNHLGIMNNPPVELSSSTTNLDFTDANNPITFGTNAQTTISMPLGTLGMWGGDTDGDGTLSFANDGNNLLFEVLFDPGNASFSSLYTDANDYYNGDMDLSGNASFQDDLNSILFNVLFHPSNGSFSSLFTFTEQLPNSSSKTSKTMLQRREYIGQKLKEIQTQINTNN